MRYVGGKGRIAKAIVSEIRKANPDATTAVDLFTGGGSVAGALAKEYPRVHMNDAQEDIALMWQAVTSGWDPPTVVTEDEYAALKHATPSALRGFVGSGGSFGGKWFGGYARGGLNSDGTPRNHQAESARAVARIAKALRSADVTVTNLDYREVEIPAGAAVYADPPYAGTLGYQAGAFDHQAFWAWASTIPGILVSEYQAPEGWKSIWSAEKRQSVTRPEQGREMRVEHLWMKEDE